MVLDFGTHPYLAFKLHIDVGTTVHQQQLESLKKKLEFKHWTESNYEIIRQETDQTHGTKDDTYLLDRYSIPNPNQLADVSFLKESLTDTNYVERMHKLLNIEEIQQLQIVDRYFHYKLIVSLQF